MGKFGFFSLSGCSGSWVGRKVEGRRKEGKVIVVFLYFIGCSGFLGNCLGSYVKVINL